MSKSKNKPQKVTKGMPSAVLLSIVIHVGLFLLAGMLVVFTVVKKEEPKFEPPKAIERPKMKLKKPKVKIKKTSKPKPTTRIVTKINRASMPDIQIPEMSGMSEGLSGGPVGGFDMMPDFNDVTVFGGGQSIGNDFVGTFYDFKRSRQGSLIVTGMEEFVDKLTAFVASGWKTSRLSRYYRSPQKLYTTSFMVPATLSSLGPRAFGEEARGWTWMALYKGQLVYPEDIKFRFWGFGDDILLVRVDGKLVLNGCWHNNGATTFITLIGGGWDSSSSDDSQYYYGNNKARVGDWIELKAGEPLDMEVMIGEVPGGIFSAMLTVQVEGVEYPRNRQGGPILPMFTTAEPSRRLQDIIYSGLVQNEASVTNGPIFRDYTVAESAPPVEEATPLPEPDKQGKEEEKTRAWTLTDGKGVEAEYVTLISGKVVLKTARGKQVKVPLAKLSPADREYIELLNPPKFSIDFVKLSKNKPNRYKPSPYNPTLPPRVNDFTFGAKVKKQGAGDYNQPLMVEYFAIGKERLGEKFVLLDRQSSTFVPNKENGYSLSFQGEPLEMIEYVNFDHELYGIRPDGNIVIITDKRGRIIQHSSSKAWLWKNIENLKKLPINAYMDKTCTRVYPTSPKPFLW